MNLSSFFYVIDSQWNWSHEVILKNIFVKDILKKNSRRKLLESLYIFTMYSKAPNNLFPSLVAAQSFCLPVFFSISCNFPSTVNRTLCLNIPSYFDNRDLAKSCWRNFFATIANVKRWTYERNLVSFLWHGYGDGFVPHRGQSFIRHVGFELLRIVNAHHTERITKAITVHGNHFFTLEKCYH